MLRLLALTVPTKFADPVEERFVKSPDPGVIAPILTLLISPVNLGSIVTVFVGPSNNLPTVLNLLKAYTD